MRIGEVFVNPEVDKQEILNRVGIAELWISGAEKVVELTKNEKARELFNTFLKNSAVCKPISDGLIPVQGPDVPTIFIIPIFPEEKEISETTRRITIDKSQTATFTENTPGRIYFDANTGLSDVWKGLVLLHEVVHADNYLNNIYPNDHSEHWLEEVDAFSFEHQLLASIGSKKYADYLNTQLNNLTESYLDSGEKTIKIDDFGPIDEIFGPPLSDIETNIRKSVIFYDVVFRMFDNFYPITARQEKAAMIQQIH